MPRSCSRPVTYNCDATATRPSYLSEVNSRSRAGGILYLGDADTRTTTGVHGAIDYLSCIISTVVSSAAEAEYVALFSGRPRSNLRQSDVGIANRSVKQKRSKAINMRYHWIRDQVDLEAVIIEYSEPH